MNIISKISNHLKKHKKLISRIAITAVVLGLIGSTATLAYAASHYESLYNKQIETTKEQRDISDTLVKENNDLESQNEELNKRVKKQKKAIESYKVKVKALEAEESKTRTVTPTTTSSSSVRTVVQPNVKSTSNVTTSSSYPVATQIWKHLKSLGLNDYVCAGIMGNIMSEVGGQTLNINPSLGSSYYGICQWGGNRRTRLVSQYGTSLDAQLKFLSVELFEVIPSGSSFYSMQSEKEAALYFARYYERCSSSTYGIRQSNATTALNYFT